MTSRERVIAAINHQQPDRCPIDLGGCGQTGMNVSTMYRLRKALGLDDHRLKVIEPFQMLGEVEEDLRKAVHSDVVGLWNTGNMMGYKNDNWKPWDMDDKTPTYMGGGFEYDVNEKGDKMFYCCGDRTAPYSCCMPKNGSFFDNVAHTTEAFDWDIDEADLTPISDYKEDFAVATDEDARYWEEESKRLYSETNYAIMGVLGGAGLGDVATIPGPTIRNPKGIRTIEGWLTAHAMFPDYISEIFEYQTDIMLKNLEIYKQAVGERISICWISGTDFGTQQGSFTGIDSFRKLYKPHYTKINNWVHTHTGWKTFYHTCGCINSLLDDLAEMGVDCLNPVQLNAMEAKGMSAQRLKDEYGDKFTFYGGGVDTQKTLPFGTPDQVREEVAKRVEIFNKGGGFIFNTIHNVVSNVPVENLIAMYETVIGTKIK
ncbi:MAG: uroporphyrinogen decarboxylase family protein [Oscillospiraceae bacterium]